MTNFNLISLDQSKVWIILTLSAMGLQIISQQIEKNESLFPAIAKTNRLRREKRVEDSSTNIIRQTELVHSETTLE